MPTRPPAREQPTDTEAWHSPGWQDGLEWVRSQLDRPPEAPLRRPRRRRRR